MRKLGALLILILIISLAAFLRFYRLSEQAPFNFDQEYAANFAYSVINNFPIRLIGQELSVPGLFMDPLYFYYLVPFFLLSSLHPIGAAVGSVIWGLAIVLTYFLVAKIIFGTGAGLIAAYIRAIIFESIIHDQSMVPVYSSELLVLLTWLLFYRYWHGHTKILPLLGLVFGLFTSIHPILFPFYLVFLVLLVARRRLPRPKTILLSLVFFVLPITPLIAFEYFHKLQEVRNLLSFAAGPSLESDRLSRLLSYLQFNLGEPYRIFGLNHLPKDLFLLLFLFLAVLLVIRKVGFWKDKFHWVMISLSYFIFLAYYTYLPSHVPEYYFLALTTLVTLYIAGSLSLLINKKLALVLLLVLVNISLVNIHQFWERLNNPSLSNVYHKDTIVRAILTRQPADQEFFVSYISLPGWNFGFNYLFKYYGHQPQTVEARPPVYTIVLPAFLSEKSIDIKSGNIGLILPK